MATHWATVLYYKQCNNVTMTVNVMISVHEVNCIQSKGRNAFMELLTFLYAMLSFENEIIYAV